MYFVNPGWERSMEQETKMTRQEAVKKIERAHAARGTVFTEQCEKIADALEALGLIKFEDEKPKETIWIGDVNGCNNEHSMKMVKAALEAAGYRIVKIGQKGLRFKCGNGEYVVGDEFLEQS